MIQCNTGGHDTKEEISSLLFSSQRRDGGRYDGKKRLSRVTSRPACVIQHSETSPDLAVKVSLSRQLVKYQSLHRIDPS